MEIDLDNSLEIKIRNTQPVALEDLSLSLLAFGQQFHKFVEAEVENGSEVSAELLIKEVRSGSIVVELVSQSVPIAPLLWQGGSLLEWSKVVQNLCAWLLGKIDNAPKEYSKQDLQQWNRFVEPVAKDGGSQMNINVAEGGKVINQIVVSSTEAKAMQNQIERLVDDMDEPEENIHRKKVMYWYQTKFDPNSDTGNRAIIDDISRSALKVVFENKSVKEEMLQSQPRFGKPWQELAYIVDVEVQTVRGKPKVYKVLKYYPEYTFDPDVD
ncbi:MULTISPECIES: hypothetical protein [unclassified Guyparkeria]|uniref:hypothetical protein n=1 Tax=unclassified Guyparkeria TaxID=2626246 RepID=UPI0018D20246|nr:MULTISPECIES: hypothetical protein [unclassified Guyparkeria]